jgi:hypothetical protein
MAWWNDHHRRAAVGSTRLLTFLSLTNSFDRLARFYRTDKSSLGNDYSEHYARHLGPRRFERCVLLEIGVGGGRNPHAGGNSLHVWRDYLPRATIVGLDLFAKELPFLGRRVHLMEGDQSSADDLDRVVDRFGPPEIVVDDGSHVGSDVITSFTYLFDRMKPGGMYVVEDLFCSFHEEFGGSEAPGVGTVMGLLDDLLRSAQRIRGTSSGLPTATGVAAVHVYPGIAFIEKRDRDHAEPEATVERRDMGSAGPRTRC